MEYYHKISIEGSYDQLLHDTLTWIDGYIYHLDRYDLAEFGEVDTLLNPGTAKMIYNECIRGLKIEYIPITSKNDVVISIPDGTDRSIYIQRIKEFRSVTRLGLKDAKEAVDVLCISPDKVYTITIPFSLKIDQTVKESLENLGFCVIMNRDILPDELFEI